MTRSIWLDEERSARERVRDRYDVAIIGSGIIGAGCAYHCARRGLSSIVLEASKVGSGATGRNAGFVLRGIQGYYNVAVRRYGRDIARQVYAFTEENQALLRQFLDQHQARYHSGGSYLLACSLEELEDLAQSAKLMAEDGFAVEYVKEDPLDRDFYGALHVASDIGINPVETTRLLIKASAAPVAEEETVTRIDTDGAGLIVHTPHRIVECKRVLIAAGAYAPWLDDYFTDKLVPARGQILVTKPLRERLLDKLCYANYGWEYFRQLDDNRLLLGGCRQMFMKEEMGYGEMVTAHVQEALEDYLKDRFPEVAGVRIDYRFSGLMSFTQDGLPIVGELKKVPGAFYAIGCNGHGLSYGLRMSKLLVDLAMDDADPGIFRAERGANATAGATALAASGP